MWRIAWEISITTHLTHNGFTHLEAAVQWPGGVRGCKTLQCNSPSLEPEFGFFKLEVKMVIAKASHVFRLGGLDASPHTTALCQAAAVPCPRRDAVPSRTELGLHTQTLWQTAGKGNVMTRTPGQLLRLTLSSGQTGCKRPNTSL